MTLSIIIVSYNTKKDIKNCLESIYESIKNISFEVIVVDNVSEDGSVKMIQKRFKKVKLIEAGTNLGFGRANNLGFKHSKGDYILLLNSDTIINPNTVKSSLKQAKQIKNLGAFSCRLLFEDKTTQPSGGFFPTLARVFFWQFGIDDVPILNKLFKSIHPSASFYKDSFSPDWITGAFMMIPRAVYKKTKGFDENIFMYGEELELCYRINQLGKKIVYKNKPTLIHLQGKSSSSRFAITKEVEGIVYFFKKHKPTWQLPLVILIFKLGSLLRLILFGIIIGNEQKKAAYQEIFLTRFN